MTTAEIFVSAPMVMLVFVPIGLCFLFTAVAAVMSVFE